MGETIDVEDVLGVLQRLSSNDLINYLVWLLSVHVDSLVAFEQQWSNCALHAMRTVVPAGAGDNVPDTDASFGVPFTGLVLPESFSAVEWAGVAEFDLGQSMYRHKCVGVMFLSQEPHPTVTARVAPLGCGHKVNNEQMHVVTVRFARDTLHLIGFHCTCTKHTGSLFCEHAVAVMTALQSKSHPSKELRALLDMCEIDRIDLEAILAGVTVKLGLHIRSRLEGGAGVKNIWNGLTKTIRDWLACPDSVLGVGVSPSQIHPNVLGAITVDVQKHVTAWTQATTFTCAPPGEDRDYPRILQDLFITCKRYVGMRDFSNGLLLLQAISQVCLPPCLCTAGITRFLRDSWDYMFSMCPHMGNDHVATLENLLDELSALSVNQHLDLQWIRNHRARVVGQVVLRTPIDALLDLVFNEVQCVSPRPLLFELVLGVAVREEMDCLQALTALSATWCLPPRAAICKQYLHTHQLPANPSKVSTLTSMASFFVASGLHGMPDLDSVLVQVHSLVPDCLPQVVANCVVFDALHGDWKLAEAATVARAMDASGWPQHAELATSAGTFKEYPTPEHYHRFRIAARALGLGSVVEEIVPIRLINTKKVDIGTMTILQSLLLDIHTGLVPRGTHVQSLLLLAVRAVCPWPCIHTHVQPIKGCSLWALPSPYMEGRIEETKKLIEKVFPSDYKNIVRTAKMLLQAANSKITPKGIKRTCTRLRSIRSSFADWKMDDFYDTMLRQATYRSRIFDPTKDLWDQLEQVYLHPLESPE